MTCKVKVNMGKFKGRRDRNSLIIQSYFIVASKKLTIAHQHLSHSPLGSADLATVALGLGTVEQSSLPCWNCSSVNSSVLCTLLTPPLQSPGNRS